MVNNLLYQNWFWYNIIEYQGIWKELLLYRMINKRIKNFIYDFLINTLVVKPIAVRRFIQINKCDNCGIIGNNFHRLHYKEYTYPVRVIIICPYWKCRYAGLLSYCNDFKERDKFVCFKKLPLKNQETIIRTNGEKELTYNSPFFLKKMNDKWYIFCYWYSGMVTYTKYVSINNFNISNPQTYLLNLIYKNKYFDRENITLLELFEREW